MNLSALQHSTFLQSLGWAIANNLWQAATLWIIYQIVLFSYKNSTSRLRNNLSTGLLFLIFAWFLVTFISKYFSLQSNADIIPISRTSNEYLLYATSFDLSIAIKKIAGTLPFLSLAYLLLLVALTIRLINSYLNIYFIKNHGLRKPPVEWRLFAEKVSLHMGITKKIRLWFSDHVDVPATIGFIKPFILIPIASINHLSPQQVEAIILHELSHIRRNDYLINLVISLIETILFFNPFVVLLVRILKRERENCCDDFVIQYQYDRHSYASALLSLELTRNKNIRLSLAATSGKKQLLHRIQRIMEAGNSNNINYGQKLLALLLITGIICSIAWLSPEKREQGKKIHAKSQTIQQTNFRVAKTEKKKNIAIPSVPKMLTVKNISNKIAEALHEGINQSTWKQPEDSPPVTKVENDDPENSIFSNVFNDRLKNELTEPIKEQDFFNNKKTKTKNAFLLAPKINLNQFTFFKQLQGFDSKHFNEYLDKISKQFSVEQLGKIQAQILKTFDSLHLKQSVELDQQWSGQQLKKIIDQIKEEYVKKERIPSQILNKLLIETNKRHIDSILTRRSTVNGYYYKQSSNEAQHGYEFYNTPHEPPTIEVSPEKVYRARRNPETSAMQLNQERIYQLRRNSSPFATTRRGLLQINTRLKNKNVDCKYGEVYFNGKAMKNLTTHTPTIEGDNEIVIFSDGSKILEIHLDNQ